MKSKKIKIILPLILVLGLVGYHYGDKMESNFYFNLENLLAVPSAMAENGICEPGSCYGNGNWLGAYPVPYEEKELVDLGFGIKCTITRFGVRCEPSEDVADWCDEQHFETNCSF